MPILISRTEKYILLFVFVVLMSAGFSSCRQKPHYQANISDVEIPPIEIKRYDEVLFSIDPTNLRQELEPYYAEYYLFLGEELNTPSGQQQLYDYLTDPFIKEVYADTQAVWSDLSSLEEKLTLAFRYFAFHFPELPIPNIYSYISGIDFDSPVYYRDGNVVIGLDMFLGQDYHYYDRLRIPVFKRVRFTPDAAPVELMRTIGRDFIHQSAHQPDNLLDIMIQEGKLLYFLDAMYPTFGDSLKIYYSSEHIAWAEENEGQSWAYMLNNEMLYTTDRQLIQKLTGDAPFTGPFSGESAPRMGVYIGWQIVREYMRRQQEVTLQQLLFSDVDSREILSQSRYRP